MKTQERLGLLTYDFLGHGVMMRRKRFEQELKRYVSRSVSTVLQDLRWLSGRCICMYIMIDRREEWRESHGQAHLDLMFEELLGLFYTEFQDGVATAIGGEAIFAVFPLLDGEKSLVHRFHQRVETRLRASSSLGYTIIRGREQLAAGYAVCRQVIQKRFFRGIGRVFELDGSRRIDTAAEKVTPKYSWTNMAKVIEEKIKHWRGEIKSADRVKMEAGQIMSSLMYAQGATGSLPELFERIRQTETLDQLEDLLMTALAETGALNSGMTWEIIGKATEFMRRRYKEEIHLQEVADHVHLSRSYFSILFKKHTGSSFIDYIHALRISEAKRLLLQNEYKIYEIAEETGFNDVKYFSKLFKKLTGQTPQEYREQQISGKESGGQCDG